MWFVSINEKDNPDLPDRLVRADFRRLAAFLRRKVGPAVIAGQEVADEADDAAIDEAFPARGRWAHIFRELETPIVFTRRWLAIITVGKRQAHGGKAATSPSRWYCWAVLRHRWRKRIQFVFMATHMVSGKDNPARANREWRQVHWAKHWDEMGSQIAAFLQQGLTVYLAGDFNDVLSAADLNHVLAKAPGSTAGFVVKHRIDAIVEFLPAEGGVRFEPTEAAAILDGYATDHRPIARRGRLVAR